MSVNLKSATLAARFATMVSLALIFVLLQGCAQPQKPQVQEQPKQDASKKQWVMKLGTDEPATGPVWDAMNRFKQLVEQRTNGAVSVKLYPAQQLGSAREMIEATQTGAEEAVLVPSSNFTGFVPAASIPDLPYLFPTRKIAREVLAGDAGDRLLKPLEKFNLKGIAWWECGVKQFTTNFPVSKPDDFRGKKIRVMPNPILIAQFESLGASAVPINFGELYNALQQGVVDGQENPINTIHSMKFYEVQKYLVLSDHGYLPYIFALNAAWWNSLPQDFQNVIRNTAKEVNEWLTAEHDRLEETVFLPDIEKSGTKVLRLTDDQKQQFMSKMRDPTREALLKLLDEEGKKILSEIDEKVKELSKR